MTDNIEKFRSLFLAALMVVSVVALSASLAGTAAAGVATADRSVSDSTPSPGSDVTVTTTVEMDSDGGSLALTDSFSPNVESASIQTIEINGQQADFSQIAASGADSGAATVTLQNVPGDATVEITYTITTADQANEDYTITGTATSGDTEADVGSTTITTSGDDDDDPEPPTEPTGDAAPLNSGDTFYTGQDVTVDGLTANTDYRVVDVNDDNEPDTLQKRVTADANGEVEFTLDGGVSEGEFVIINDDGDVVNVDDGSVVSVDAPTESNTRSASFDVIAMDLSAEFDDANVGNDGGSSTVDYEVESDVRNDYEVNITADGDLDTDELADIFGDEADVVAVYDDEETITITQAGSSSGEGEYELDFQDIDAGTYTFEASAADADASDSDDIDVEDTDDASADFNIGERGSFAVQQRGDVSNLTIELDNTDEATIQVGNLDNSGYAIVADVTDDDEDGVAYVEFNSFTAGNDGATTLTAGDDDTDLTDVRTPAGSFDDNDPVGVDVIDAADYDLFVAEGDVSGTLSDGNTADNRATLRLEEPSLNGVQVWTAPEAIESDIANDDVEDLPAYIEAGNLTQTDAIAQGDTVVVEVDGSGFEGALETGPNDQVYTDSSAQGTLFTLEFEGDTAVNQDDVDINVDDLGEENVSVLYDGENDAHYVVFDSDVLVDQFAGHEDGDEYTANFTVYEDPSDLFEESFEGDAEDSISVTQAFDIEDPEIELALDVDNEDQELIFLPASSNAEVSGDTNLAPGSEVEVSLDSDTSTDPFVKRPEATVQADGTFTAVADFSENEAGSNFTAEAIVGDVTSDEYDGQLTEGEPEPPETTTTTDTVTEPPTTTTTEPTETTTEPMETTTAGSTATDGGDDGGEEETTSSSGPGFTAALALIALVAAALLAVRRNN